MALTGQAPFNNNQFRSFALTNVRDAPQIPMIGTGTATESQDTAAGSGSGGGVRLVVSSLNLLRTGPRANKFRSRLAASFTPAVISVTGSAAITEPSDIAAANGTVSVPIVSSLSPANLGPAFAAPFNLNQFRALQQGAASQLAIVGSASITEPSDVATGSGVITGGGSGAAVEAGDVSLAAGIATDTGVGAAPELPDIAAGSGGTGATGAAAIIEPSDSSIGIGVTSTTGTAAAPENPDTAAGIGLANGGGSGSALESPDIAGGNGISANPGTAGLAEPADVAAAIGGQSTAGSGAPLESHDTATAGSGFVILPTVARGEIINFDHEHDNLRIAIRIRTP